MSDLNVTFPFESFDWTPENGFPEAASLDWLPWRAWGAGSHLGLSIVLDANLDEYYCSSEVSIGFKVNKANQNPDGGFKQFNQVFSKCYII